MKPKLILCLALVLNGCLIGCLIGCSTTSNRPAATYSPVQLQNHAEEIFNKIEQQIPELGTTGIDAGTVSSSDVWHGDEYASGGFFLLKNPRYPPKEFFRLNGMSSEKPLPDLLVTIHRYASSGDAQQDLKKGLFRNQGPLPKENYKGAILYRWLYSTGKTGTVVCQSGSYIIEINPNNGDTNLLVMKVLDVVLAELNSLSRKPK